MAFELKNPPEFTVEVEQWTKRTEADGEEMAKPIGKLLNNDIYLKEQIEKQKEQQSRVTFVTLTAAGWEGDAAPFAQTVTIDEAREELEALLVSALEDGASLETQKAYTKAYGIICSGTAKLGDGTATFKVYKKPETDIVIGLKGV